ncbi:MAG: O-antigen ligase family protein [Oscillospiraceae bacterium]|nr:O-antigen ligase family protein [Oscillospiraceae bacterium]
MKEIFSRIKVICKSKSFSEMIENFPNSYIEFMAFFPLLLFMVLPLWQLIHNFISPNMHGISYNTKVLFVFLCACTVGGIAIVLNAAKKLHENGRPTLKSVVKNNIPMVFFLFVILMMIISTVINGFTTAAVQGDSYRHESVFYFIGYFAVYFLSATIITEKKLRAVLMYTFISASLPVAVFTLLDKWVVSMEAFDMCAGPSAVFHQFNHYGYYLIIVILSSAALFIKEKNTALRVLCMASFVLNTVMLIVNNTFGCFLACFCALIFNCIVISITEKKFNKLSIVMVALFTAITFVMSFWVESVFTNIIQFAKDVGAVSGDPENAATAGTGRWTLWTHTAEYIKEKPVFGFGVDGISKRLDFDTQGVNNRPHNEFLQYAVFFGIPAAIAYICGVFSVFTNGLKNKFNLDGYAVAALVAAFAYLVSSVFGNTMYYTAPYLFILLGLGFVKGKPEKRD